MELNQILVPKMTVVSAGSPLQLISSLMNTLERVELSKAPWREFPYKPKVQVAVAYTSSTLLLKFYVKEKEVRVTYFKNNDPVYKDSCVEFFISFDEGSSYFNFEFNAIGACLAAYGKNKLEREMLCNIEIVRTRTVINRLPEGFDWELTAVIPFEILQQQPEDFANRTYRANFYKCGDETSEPHFVSWNHIISGEPNFHLPEFFGRLQFAP